MALRPGESLQNGKYIVEREIGRGRYGITYRVGNEYRKRRIVKTPNDELLRSLSSHDGETVQKEYGNDLVKLAKCQHPHAVKVESIFTHDDRWCVATEYIRGVPFDRRLGRKMSIPKALYYLRQLCDALEVAHQRGLLHRDIQPVNIMRRQGRSEVVLIDFGLARGVHALSTMQAAADGFAPIEIYEGDRELTPATDVYSLAATLYAWVTGEVPPSALDRQRGTAELASPKEFNSKIDDRLETAIVKGMALEPSDRPQSIVEWRQLFDKLPEKDPGILPDWEPKTWAIVLATGGVILAAIALGIFALTSRSPSSPESTDSASIAGDRRS